jgi:hypothetical protein
LEREIDRLVGELKEAGISEYVRNDIVKELEDKQSRLEVLKTGASMGEWQERMSRHSLIPQFFSREHATGQVAKDWSQAVWDGNARMVRRSVKAFLVREFVTPGWDSLTLETLGLAEVSYPGLESAQLRPQFLIAFPTGVAGRLRSEWTRFLASLCDTLRNDAAVTLGSEQEDYETYHYPVGRWVSRSE